MRQNSATDFFTPSVLPQPCNADEWMAFGRAAFKIWMAFIIHVVQQAHGLPKIGIFAAQLRKMFHRISDCVAMFLQAFGLDPLVENI